jgi:hypothetical protein
MSHPRGRGPADDDVPIEELARQQGVGPVTSLDELAQPELWETEQEYEDFLSDLYASRRSDVAELHRLDTDIASADRLEPETKLQVTTRGFR